MPMHFINLRGQPVAAIIDHTARISPTLPNGDRPIVEAMCLYALQIVDGTRPGPYNDDDAHRHARTILRSPHAARH